MRGSLDIIAIYILAAFRQAVPIYSPLVSMLLCKREKIIMGDHKAVVSPLSIKIIGISFVILGFIESLVKLFFIVKGTSSEVLRSPVLLVGGVILIAISVIIDNQKKLDKKLDSLSKEQTTLQ